MVEEIELDRWRNADAAAVLIAFAEYAKKDATFEPIKSRGTTRWHARVAGQDFELLLASQKFFDTRGQRGGGGAVDLAMHLLRCDFKSAVGALRKAGL